MFPETRNAPSQAALESPTCVRAGRFRSERLRGGRLLRPRGGVRARSWDQSPPLLTGPGSPRPDASCCRADAAGPGNRGGGRERSRSHCRWGSPKFLALKCYTLTKRRLRVTRLLDAVTAGKAGAASSREMRRALGKPHVPPSESTNVPCVHHCLPTERLRCADTKLGAEDPTGRTADVLGLGGSRERERWAGTHGHAESWL